MKGVVITLFMIPEEARAEWGGMRWFAKAVKEGRRIGSIRSADMDVAAYALLSHARQHRDVAAAA